jgi:hypothetical protein
LIGLNGAVVPQSIDHIVIAVRDLERASADFAAAGFTVTPGGEHTGGATHNALVSFVDGAYFELIAIKDPEKAKGHRWFEALDRADGAIDFALLAPGLEETSTRLSEAGLAGAGPRNGGRLRPDGRQVEWRTLQLTSDPAAPLPFLIEDLTPRALRVPDGAATRHPLGNLHVAGLTIAVGDLATAATAFTALLGPSIDRPDAETAGGQAGQRFRVGSQWIDLLQPGDAESDIGRFRQARGDGIARIVLAGAGSGSTQTLPGELTHGVQIRVDE